VVFIIPKRIYETAHDKKRSYIFVANHVSYLDAAFLVEAIRQPLRPLAKIEMKKVPVFGFIYGRATVAVDRKSAEHRAQSVRILTSIIRKGISILVFPEGTFNMSGKPLDEFYDGAFRVAIETQTPIKPILFLDTYDRMKFHHVLTLNPGKCRCVYLEEIPVNGLTHHDVQALKSKVYFLMEQQLKNYGAGWIH
jgi:1-acyl-sn-glycerol-3-phosphate acyltransferase